MGVGYIVTVKLAGLPVHPFNVGVTVILPVIFEPVPLGGAFHCGIFPVPLAEMPIAVFEFTHEKELPVGLLVKAPGLIVEPGQTEILDTAFVVGVG